jgi:hypothetical protein
MIMMKNGGNEMIKHRHNGHYKARTKKGRVINKRKPIHPVRRVNKAMFGLRSRNEREWDRLMRLERREEMRRDYLESKKKPFYVG